MRRTWFECSTTTDQLHLRRANFAGTDFTVQFRFPGSSLHEELVELVKQLGMTPHEALQSATRHAAEMFG
jgi:imidazolonepropionase-like amidohydrolase